MFKYLEVLAAIPANDYQTGADQRTTKQVKAKEGMASLEELIDTIQVIVTETSDEDGWAFLGEVGKRLNKRYPDFDTRNYGHTKLTPLISSLKQFEIQSRKTNHPYITHKYIKTKNKNKKL